MSMLASAVDPRKNLGALAEFAAVLRARRELILELARRDIADRYLAQTLGSAWAVINPLLISGLYCVLFIVVFPTRAGTALTPLTATAYILIGLAPWLASVEVMNRAVLAMTSNASLVRQVVFPVEVLPLQVICSSAVTLAISLGVAVLVSVLAQGPSLLPVGLPLLLAALVLHALFLAGLAFLLAALGAFIRDTKDVIGFLSAAGLFLAPILFLPEVAARLPEPLRLVIAANPFTYIIACYRDALFFGAPQASLHWLVTACLAVVSLAGGYRLFRWTKPFLSEVV